jgi:hypothetical protein
MGLGSYRSISLDARLDLRGAVERVKRDEFLFRLEDVCWCCRRGGDCGGSCGEMGTGFARVPVRGVGRGVSASSRFRAANVLAAPFSTFVFFRRPGFVTFLLGSCSSQAFHLFQPRESLKAGAGMVQRMR